jgi:hypothetical protein
MKYFVFALSLMLSPLCEASSLVRMECRGAGTLLNFEIDYDGETIKILHADGLLENAQWPVNQTWPVKLSGNTLSFDYDWYFVAHYTMEFATPIREMDPVPMWLTADDFDGLYLNRAPFSCDRLP